MVAKIKVAVVCPFMIHGLIRDNEQPGKHLQAVKDHVAGGTFTIRGY